MIPIEIKARILLLYWGQQTVYYEKGRRMTGTVGGITIQRINQSNPCLLVTPVSKITDEDATEIAKIVYPESEDWHIDMQSPQNGKSFLRNLTARDDFEFDVFSVNYPWDKIVKIIDFIRSSGYAISAYGYSVEQLVKEKVFTLIK